jgi:hypothetical protein
MTADGENLPFVIKFYIGDKDFNPFLLLYDQLELAFSNYWIQPVINREVFTRRYFKYFITFLPTFSGDVYCTLKSLKM